MNKNINIFVDFDGTLIDSTQRMYLLFKRLAPELSLSYVEYIKLKKSQICQRDILERHLNYSEKKISAFRKLWFRHIEDEDSLKIDRPLRGAAEFLNKISASYSVYLVTARQSKTKTVSQVNNLGLNRFFKDILVTRQRESKAQIILSETSVTDNDIIIGDTGEDVIAGKQLSIRTAAVTTGTINAATLVKYNPDIITKSINTKKLIQYIKQLYEN
jgi:phosphoglycolate phosphatase